MSVPTPRYAHLLAMTDARATFEHARFTEPRREHGYCTDDMARVLLVTSRERARASEVRDLATKSLRFLADAQGAGGAFRNRMSVAGRWLDRPVVEDCWGRSLWGLGTAIAGSEDDEERELALLVFTRGVQRRSRWSRATAFAALGAAAVLGALPEHRGARALLSDAARSMVPAARGSSWLWPEERLEYANAVLAEAMVVTGATLELPALFARGLELLEWLLDHEHLGGHLSVTPVGGADVNDRSPAFDQQPIEVAAIADACASAVTLDGARRWSDGVADAAAWFLGDNDVGVAMWDPESGGGYDGLLAGGVNLNCGAESTLALLSTLQHAQRLAGAVH